MTEQPRVIVLENDQELSDRFKKYLSDKDYKEMFMADQQESDNISEQFVEFEILAFEPTQIVFSQYNLMLMILYDLLQKGTLKIRQIHIFTSKEERVEKELKEIWKDRRTYLEEVLKVVKVYTIDNFDFSKHEISL